MNRLAFVPLLALAVGLGITVAWELGVLAPDAAGPVEPRHIAVSAAPDAVAPDHTAQWLATILARPLFNPDRRPSPVAASVAGAPAGLPRLAGILVGPFGRSAIFVAADRKPLVVGEGAHVNAWVVGRIHVDSVELIGPDGTRTLHPAFQSAPATTVAPVGHAERIGWSLPR